MGKQEDQGEKLLDAAEAGDIESVNLLIKEGVNVDHLCDMSWTALIYASQEGHTHIVKALVDAGANVLYETPKGKTPLSVAKNQAIKDILENPPSVFSAGADAHAGAATKEIPVQEGEFSFADMIAADEAAKAAKAADDGVTSTRYAATITIMCESLSAAYDFYVRTLGFNVVQDTGGDDTTRFLVVSPSAGEASGSSSSGASFLLNVAKTEAQKACVGKQCGDAVMGIIHTDHFYRDYEEWCAKGVNFCEDPRQEAYGTVCIFQDLYGNKFDLIDSKLVSSARE